MTQIPPWACWSWALPEDMASGCPAPADPCASPDAHPSLRDWEHWALFSQHLPRVPPQWVPVCWSRGHRVIASVVGTPQHCPIPRDTTGTLCWLRAAGSEHRESSCPARILNRMLGRGAA